MVTFVGTDVSKRSPVSLTSSPLSCLLDLCLWALISVVITNFTRYWSSNKNFVRKHQLLTTVSPSHLHAKALNKTSSDIQMVKYFIENSNATSVFYTHHSS